MMRVIFIGTDKFAVPLLKRLADSQVELVCVITQPDQPKGRGLKVSPPPIKEFALEKGLEIYQPPKIKHMEVIQKIRDIFRPDLIIVSAYGQILPKDILEIPPYGCINVHPSLLPKYRGAAPIQRAIINGENETGVTFMFMDEGEDTGDIIIQKAMKIEISDTADILSGKLAELSTDMLTEILNWNGRKPDDQLILPRKPQDNSKATYAPKLKKEEGLINWGKTSLEIHNLIRGTIPWPNAYTTFNNNMLKIWKSCLSERTNPPDSKPGMIINISVDLGIGVATGDKELIIKTVQPPNKPKMEAKDFINGYRIKIGDRFGI